MLDIEEIKKEKPIPELASFQQEFLEDRLKDIEELEPNITQADYIQIKKTAHNWKGFSEPYGFQMLGTLARTLEGNAIASDHDACTATFNQIKEYMNIKKDFIK